MPAGDAQDRGRVASARVGHLATVTPAGDPHVVPFCFVLVDDRIVSVVDAKPKSSTELRRLANIEAHGRATVLVDHYDDDWSQLWWVRIDGAARVVREGPEYDAGVDALVAKYVQYQNERPTGALVVIDAERWRSWG